MNVPNKGSNLDLRVLEHFKETNEILPAVRPSDARELLDAIPKSDTNPEVQSRLLEVRRRLAGMIP